MRSYNIHIIRHGATALDNEKKFHGCRIDDELSNVAVKELINLRSNFIYPSVDAVYTSTLTRCLQTADVIYPNVERINVPLLNELDFGDFTEKSIDELSILPEFKAWMADAYHTAPPNGESGEQFMKRILNGFNWVVRDMMKAEIFDSAIITHGNTITSLLSGVAIPRKQPQQWLVTCGRGYTCRLTAQLWHRDGIIEVLGYLPHGVKDAMYN